MRRAKYYKDAWDVVVVLLAILLAAVVVLWAGQAAGQQPEEPKIELIVSPWQGVFHAAESGGARPFVEVGSYVTPSTVVGYINVDIMQPQRRMEVYAGVQGTVTQLLVEDGDFVTAGQPVMAVRLDPDGVIVRP